MINNISENIFYVGVDDHDVDLFEAHFNVPNGMAYNSYIIVDEKIAVCDAMELGKIDLWMANISEVIGDRNPDYLVITHMEPDHSAAIDIFCSKYPNVTIVGNTKTFNMIDNFFPAMKHENRLVVKEGDVLELGVHSLEIMMAPMIHWPEVMMCYEKHTKTLFSADAFGKFGALDVEDDWACEARRYYFGIVGKYGVQTQAVLKKIEHHDIKTICSLHGPVLKENIEYYINLYDIWSSYRPESEGVCLFYTSVYGHTKDAALKLEKLLLERGVPKVAVADLVRDDMAEAVEDAFRYDTLVLATTTYNAEMFPKMKIFIDELKERNYQNRRVAFIENGSWAPTAKKCMKSAMESLKNIEFVEQEVTIKSALNEDSEQALVQLADAIAGKYKK